MLPAPNSIPFSTNFTAPQSLAKNLTETETAGNECGGSWGNTPWSVLVLLDGVLGLILLLKTQKLTHSASGWGAFVHVRPSRLIDGFGVSVVVACSNYIESTSSTTGRPVLRLGTHRSTNSRHQRNQPVGMQIRATWYRAWVLMVTGTVSR